MESNKYILIFFFWNQNEKRIWKKNILNLDTFHIYQYIIYF